MKNRFTLIILVLSMVMITCNSPSVASSPSNPGGENDELLQVGNDQETTQPSAVSVAGDLELPRDFTFTLPLFSANSAWNQSAANAQVLPNSDQQMLVFYRVLRGDYSDLAGYDGPATTWPFIDINIDEYSIPIFRAGSGQQSVLLCDYDGVLQWPHPKFGGGEQGGPLNVPAPADQVRPSGPQNTDADGHLVLYSMSTFTAYDYFAVTTQRDGDCQSWGGGYPGNQILEAGEIDFFDLHGEGVNSNGNSSARAHGTPLLAGLILPEDVASGAIAHAMAFAIPGPRNLSSDPFEPLNSDYFYPASTTETDFYSTNPHALAAGQRIRLKQTLYDEDGDIIDENQLAPITRMFLTTLRSYGAYVVDNAGGFSFYVEDLHTANLNLTDDQVNALIGQPAGTPLPAGQTKWLIVIDQLATDLELIPFAYDESWQDGDNPETAVFDIANFEMVDPATHQGTDPALSIYLSIALKP